MSVFKLNTNQEELSQKIAEVLSENKELKYAKFDIMTMSIPDGRLATFSFVLTPLEE